MEVKEKRGEGWRKEGIKKEGRKERSKKKKCKIGSFAKSRQFHFSVKVFLNISLH